MLRTVLLSILVCSFALQTRAAEIEMLTDNEEGCTARLVGEIKEGDTDKISMLFPVGRRERDATGRPNQTLCFESPGGNLLEALSIARYLTEAGLGTHLEANATCLSACAFAFLGGSRHYTEEGWWQTIDRSMHHSATLGFHSPQLKFSSNYYNEAQLQQAFYSAIKATTLIFTRLEELQIPQDKALLFFSGQDPNEYFFIDTLFKARDTKIEITGLESIKAPQALKSEDLSPICSNFHPIWSEETYIERRRRASYLDYESIVQISDDTLAYLILYGDEGFYWFSDDSCFVTFDVEKNKLMIFHYEEELSFDDGYYKYCATDYSNNGYGGEQCNWSAEAIDSIKQITRAMTPKITRVSALFIYGDLNFDALWRIYQAPLIIERSSKLQGLQAVFETYDAETRSYLQRT